MAVAAAVGIFSGISKGDSSREIVGRVEESSSGADAPAFDDSEQEVRIGINRSTERIFSCTRSKLSSRSSSLICHSLGGGVTEGCGGYFEVWVAMEMAGLSALAGDVTGD